MQENIKHILDEMEGMEDLLIQHQKELKTMLNNINNNYKPNLNWTHIIIHHSATRDGVLHDWKQIQRYHTSYRIDYNIVSRDEYTKRKEINDGRKFQKPWSDIGYHFGIEKINDKHIYLAGRSLSSSGVHTIGMNSKAIGICLVGNYDNVKPLGNQYYMLAKLCSFLCSCFDIPFENIKAHNEFSEKTCPGSQFDMEYLRKITKSESSNNPFLT